MRLSAGVGLTNDCNLSCAHCYRDTQRIDHLSLAQVKTICESLPIGAMGFGTGESALHPEFALIVQYLHDRGVTLSVASNGHTLTSIPDHILTAFHDVEVSIDFPTKAGQDALRGPGNWEVVHKAIERCQKAGVEVSILATMMCSNVGEMAGLVGLARRCGTNLRVNVYQAVKSDAFRLSYGQFWAGFRSLFAAGMVVSCTEPVVRAVMGLGGVQSPCGRQSIRFTPRGHVLPCVYWPLDGKQPPLIEDLPRLGVTVLESEVFKMARIPPSSATDCACQGGCASRRALAGDMGQHDEYCPWVRGDSIHLDWQAAPAKDLMRSGNVCTTVVV